jgi:hypothetical protein
MAKQSSVRISRPHRGLLGIKLDEGSPLQLEHIQLSSLADTSDLERAIDKYVRSAKRGELPVINGWLAIEPG